MSEPGKHRGESWGPKEIMAIVIIAGSFLLAGIALVTDKEGATIPAWVAALVGGVALFYFKGNGGE